MGWFERNFGFAIADKPTKPSDEAVHKAAIRASLSPERVGINGEYDPSGLAKRVALAFEEDPELKEIETLWVGQTGKTIILRGKLPSLGFLEKAVNIAEFQPGTASVDTTQVTIGH